MDQEEIKRHEKETLGKMTEMGWSHAMIPAFPDHVGRFYVRAAGIYEVNIERLMGGFYVAVYDAVKFSTPDLVAEKTHLPNFTLAAMYATAIRNGLDEGQDLKDIVAAWGPIIAANREPAV